MYCDLRRPVLRVRNGSLSRRITLLLTAASAIFLLIFCSLVYVALVHKIDAEDHDLINEKAKYVVRFLVSGDSEELKTFIAERYPQDLRKRVYVAIYDDNGKNVARTFNTNSDEVADIFPVQAPNSWLYLGDSSVLERLPSLSHRSFNVSTRSIKDRHGRLWIMRIAVDHDTEERILSTVGAAFLGVFFLAIAVVPASSGLITHLIMRPLQELSIFVENTSLGRENLKVPNRKFPKEFAGLIRSFNVMSADASMAFDRLQSFSADISHELRNPLNSLRGQLEVLGKKSRTTHEYRDGLTSVLEDVDRLCQLVDSLLFLLRGERKLLKAQMTKVELNPMLHSIKELFEPILQDGLDQSGRECANSMIIDCEPGLSIYGEPNLFQRAVINLVENAIKYGKPVEPDKPQIVMIKVTPLASTSDYLELSITDNGPGIPEHEKPYIFDRLYRTDRSRNSHGFGLGLAIVRMIMDLHQGHVNVSGERGHGTTFRLIALRKQVSFHDPTTLNVKIMPPNGWPFPSKNY